MKFIFLGLLIVLYGGCSALQLEAKTVKKQKEFSCEEKAIPKSLLEIEQSYRCTSN